MIEFVAIAGAMTVVGLLFVLVPLWRGARSTAHARRAANIEVYRQRCDEIEREVAAGRLPRPVAEEEKDALGARLLEDIDAEETIGPSSCRTTRAAKPWLASLAAVVLIAGGATAGYWHLGDWQALANRGMPDIGTLMGRLKAEVAAHPDDRQARMLLAQAEQSLGDYADAAADLHRLNTQIQPPQPGLLAAEAEATMNATDKLQGRARALFAQALQLDPANREALWYLGLAASEAGQTAQAVAYWNRLLSQKLPASVRETVKSRRDAISGHKPALDDRD